MALQLLHILDNIIGVFFLKTGERIVSLISLLIILIIIGVALWLVNNYIPMDGKIKTILNVVVVIIVIVWLLNVFGVFGSKYNMHMWRIHMW